MSLFRNIINEMPSGFRFQQTFNEMQSGFRQSLVRFFFWFTAIGKLLRQDKIPSADIFFSAYMNSWWWNRLWFRSCLNPVSLKTFDGIIEGLSLAKQNETIIAKHQYPWHLEIALFDLYKASILTPENLAVVANYENPGRLASALLDLHSVGILTPENREAMANYENPGSLVPAFKDLHSVGILTPENREAVANYRYHSERLARALKDLHSVGILTPENREAVANLYYPESLARAIKDLHSVRILTPEIRAVVINHPDHRNLYSTLHQLSEGGILNQENFDSLIAPNHAALITDDAFFYVWGDIPPHLITQANFERLLTAAEQPNPIEALTLVRAQIIGLQDLQPQAAFNPHQSTHIASVHRSVSASAVRLMSRYRESLNLKQTIAAIKAYVNGLEETQKHQAAKGCIGRITAADYSFTDSSSNVSTLELLALSWLAIHDSSKCQASVEDANNVFVEGLYEIQRGYNLDDLGNDRGGEDRPICVAGTFNKLMEKLNGIHPDVEVYYITHAGASAKLLKLSQAHASAYLQSIASPEHLSVLLARLKESGNLEPIWDDIKEAVKAELWDEFKEAYGSNEIDARFVDMINYGGAAEPPNLDEIGLKLMTSAAYKAHLAYQAFKVFSIWSRPVNGRAEDKQSGPVCNP